MSFDEYFETDEDENVEDVHLVFGVGAEKYAVCVLHVIEIVRIPDINDVPQMPRAFAGVMNLRGSIIPVMDMRSCFGLGTIERSDRTVIVVLELEGERVGMMVEEVSEVLELDPAIVEPTFSARRARGGLVRSIAQRPDQVVLILDLPKLFEETENLPDNAPPASEGVDVRPETRRSHP